MTEPGSPLVSITKATPSAQIVAPFAPRLSGDGRTEATPAVFDPELLADATRNLLFVDNSAHSTGVSPVLKALLLQSGLPYAVRREIWPDGALHASGDAIDVTADDLLSIAHFLALVPTLFSQVTYSDPTYAVDCLYIQDGAVVTSGVVEMSETTSIHIASDLTRMHAQILTYGVRSALETYALAEVYNAPIPTVPSSPNDGQVGFW